MTDSARNTREVALSVTLPTDLADVAEQLQETDPAFLEVTLRYGLMRVQQQRYLRDMHASRGLAAAVRQHVEEGLRP